MDGRESAYNVGDLSSISESGRSPGEGNDNLLQYSCLENPWMEEPGGLQFIRSQIVRQDRANSPYFFFFFLEAERDLFIKRKRMERNMLVSIG